ncbi:hypothetical protein HNY73_019959 [Argiope bruennichi]|uniref:Uncharacterized protein n=1 Tax=Argiope bruennichi TaxID=94029 RepID=A0A8T0E637_ARGBR|nr:hypothetical protein HNY73_019959 [Argiope bruennichi]
MVILLYPNLTHSVNYVGNQISYPKPQCQDLITKLQQPPCNGEDMVPGWRTLEIDFGELSLRADWINCSTWIPKKKPSNLQLLSAFQSGNH